MTAWIVHCGKQYLGRLLARSKADARELAAEFWGMDRIYRIELVTR